MVSKSLQRLLSTEWIRALLIIFFITLASYLIAPLTGHSQNPIYQKSGLSSVAEPGFVSGQNTIDPNDGFTSQTLGNLSADKLLSGDMPYWNHYEGVGAPLAGGMQGASLFPLTIVQAFGDGLVYFHFLLQIIAGFAAYLFLKKLKLQQWIAVTGGVVFALNGTFAWLTNAPFNPIAFLPLLLLGIEFAISKAEKGRAGGWILIAVALSLSLYAGFPETAFLNAIFAYGWGLVRLFQIKPKFRKSLIVKVLAGSIVGLLLAAPVLVPFLDYLSHATTGGHEGGGFADIGLPISTLPALVMPYIFGPIFGLVSNGQPTDLFLFWANVGGYITAPLVFVASFSIFAKRPRGLKLYLALFIAVVILKMFAFKPVSAVVNLIPGMDMIAFYRYSVSVLSLALIILAAFGLEALTKKRLANKKVLLMAGAGLAIVGLLAALAKGMTNQLGAFPAHKPWAVLSVLWASGAILAVAGVMLYNHKKLTHYALSLILIIDTFVMFAIPLLSLPKTTPVNTAPVSFLQQNLGQQRFYTLYPIQPNYGSYYEIASINTNNLPVPKIWAEYIEKNLDSNVDAILFTGFSRHQPDGPTALEEFGRNLTNYEATGVKYLVAQEGAVTPEFAANHNLKTAYDDNQVIIYELPNPKPYFEAEGCQIQSSSQDEITVDCPQPTKLVRRELFIPGWEARTNEGRGYEIQQSGEIFQSIDYPGGKQTIKFTYTPPYINLAYTAFMVGLVAVGVTVWRQWFSVGRSR